MTKTIASQTSDTHYFLTINVATGQAEACTCGDYIHRQAARGGSCKHMKGFNQEVQRAATFQALRNRFDSRLNGDLETRRCYYEMSLGY